MSSDDHPSASPPPPPMLSMPANNSRPSLKATAIDAHIAGDACLWAAAHVAVRKACYLAHVCERTPPTECRLLEVPAILQSGPTCGLTALSMALGSSPSPAELLETARQLRLTRNGEMFSADSLLRLVVDHTALGSDERQLPEQQQTTAPSKSVWLHRGLLCTHENDDGAKFMSAVGDDDECPICAADSTTTTCIKSTLRNGGCLLVPYPFL